MQAPSRWIARTDVVALVGDKSASSLSMITTVTMAKPYLGQLLEHHATVRLLNQYVPRYILD